MKTFKEIQAIKEKFEKELLQKDDVVGVGIGKIKEPAGSTEAFCIRIYVTGEKSPEYYRKSLPDKLEEIEVEIVAVGRIMAQKATRKQ
ncbi:MAG: hypothetical protein PHD61_02030 [Bacteroidales bacterium]|nr:hypothetical protein [Lentimicrobiaceae bacterium]MDD5694067.1 hypothetical protein [Bacteroidales bacterium]